LNPKDDRELLLGELSKIWVVQRLKHINLSAVPPWLGPKVSTASRFQHSLAVGKLSLLVSGGAKHDQLLLAAAAILHDVGDGPFPHISDQIMKEKLGFAHEEALEFAFEHSPFNDSQVLCRYGLDLEEVSSVLEGRHRLSTFLYGLPDLDNTDNIHRFIKTCRGKALGEPSYRPEDIAASMTLDSEAHKIPKELLDGWLNDHKKVYSYVWNDRPNMVAWTMLGRALRILKEDLTEAFFRLTNREAFRLIWLRLPSLASSLRRGEYQIIFDREFAQFRGEAQELSEPKNIAKFEKMLCKEAGLEEWSVGLTVDKPTSALKTSDYRVYLVSYRGNDGPKALLENLLSSQ